MEFLIALGQEVEVTVKPLREAQGQMPGATQEQPQSE
jgi:hypothetical protein